MTAHVCQDCGMLHDAPVQSESPEVQIARIQAESAYKIAQLQARADKHVAEVEAEADVDVAEADAEALVAVLALSEATAEEELPEEDPGVGAPLVIAQDIDTAPEPDVPAPPVEEHHEERAPKKKSIGLGMW